MQDTDMAKDFSTSKYLLHVRFRAYDREQRDWFASDGNHSEVVERAVKNICNTGFVIEYDVFEVKHLEKIKVERLP